MYGSTGGIPYQQVMDGLGESVCMKRKLNIADVMGLEGKNTYELYNGPSDKASDFGQNHPVEMVARVGEKSSCMERCCLAGGREAQWESRHMNKTGPLLWSLDKKRNWPCCPCCSRPSAVIKDNNGQKLGRIEDPFSCCYFNEDIYDAQDRHIYHVEGHCCQVGLICPCVADAELEVRQADQPVGKIARKQLSLLEMCCPTMRYRVEFPKGATADHRVLLLSSQLMIDTVYFEMQGENGGDASALLG